MSVGSAFAAILIRACEKTGWRIPDNMGSLIHDTENDKDRAEYLVGHAIRSFLPAVIGQQEDYDESGVDLLSALMKIPIRGWSKERQLIPLAKLIEQTKSQRSETYRAISNAASAVSTLVYKGSLDDAAANAAYVAESSETAVALAWKCLEDSFKPGAF